MRERVAVYRKENFNAAHRLHNPAWDEATNDRVFGKCNNPNYHGHNYELIVKLVGDDFVGIGSDFDGVSSLPKDVDDVTSYPAITRELLRRGYSDQSVRKILGGNVLRVMKANLR